MAKTITFTEDELKYLRTIYSDEIDQTIKYVNQAKLPEQKFDAADKSKKTKVTPAKRDVSTSAVEPLSGKKPKVQDKKRRTIESINMTPEQSEPIVPTKQKAKRKRITNYRRKGIILTSWSKPLMKKPPDVQRDTPFEPNDLT